jgi:hypothetical protein
MQSCMCWFGTWGTWRTPWSGSAPGPPADAILHVLFREMGHLEDALERIRTRADIERTESIVVLSNLIDRSPSRDVG